MLGWIWGDGVGVSVQILTALQAPQKKALEKIGCGPAKPSKTVDQILGDFWFLEVRQCGAAGSDDFLAFRELAEPEKRLNQLAFRSADLGIPRVPQRPTPPRPPQPGFGQVDVVLDAAKACSLIASAVRRPMPVSRSVCNTSPGSGANGKRSNLKTRLADSHRVA